ncbi:CMGC CK2 kinase [Fusarium albosuccineum]|uniref:EKC/KEOPS complex subunit BUD32 n=1 Tax=Fusarium albosuccineum TaxID=1237068 RepID=A0A8H4L7R3_9HYPO|nr:CMGC CK2 kinase [Fusarium albosuccineum]
MSSSQRIGRGRHAIVFECRDSSDCKYAIKLFKQDSLRRVDREIEILRHLRGGPNIICFMDSVDQSGAIEHEYRSDICYYTRELLKALEFTHGRGVMHRDIRPHNVVIDHEHRKLRLIGWSSSAFYRPGQEHSLRVGLFKAPEVLVSNERYDPKIDMWCFGAMFASMMFRKEPFFHGNSISDQLDKISRVLGTERLYDYLDKYQIELDEYIIDVLGEYSPRPWSGFVNSDNEHLVSDDSLHLLDQLLRFDPEERLTASEALAYPYYQSLE